MTALALVQKIEETIQSRLQDKESISDFGEAIYPFLAECGIDSKSITAVTILFSKVIQLRNQFFPNAAFCATETLLRLLSLLFPTEALLPRSKVDKWSFILYYQEENVYNRALHRMEHEKCWG